MKEKKEGGRWFEIKALGSWSLEAGAPEAGQAENHATRTTPPMVGTEVGADRCRKGKAHERGGEEG